MKKVLYVAFMAFVMIACTDKNAPDIDKKDQTVLGKASKNVISILGKQKSEVENRIIKAGFRKTDPDIYGGVDDDAPRRYARAMQALAAEEDPDADVCCYVYNISEEQEEGDEADLVNAIIDSKKTAIIFFATYAENILVNVQGRFIVGAEVDNVNKLYLECSDNLHSNITYLGYWQGSIQDRDEEDSEAQAYMQYNAFFNALAPMNAVFATEGAGCALDMTGKRSFGYAITWDKPNESDARWQINNYGYKTAIAEAGFSITYQEYNN